MARPSGKSEAGGEHGAGAAMRVRHPAVAGTFYPADRAECAALAATLVQSSSSENKRGDDEFREQLLGGIVPHAGWICSGQIAGEVLATLAARVTPDIVVVFGAIHTPLDCDRAALSSFQKWQEPAASTAAETEISAELVAGRRRLFSIDDRFHVDEHAVEVELPLIQLVWPNAQLMAIEVPVIEDAIDIGTATAKAVADSGLSAVYLASSDLTHYGPVYRNTVAGVGLGGLQWAKENDERLLAAVTGMQVERIVPEVRTRLNACGGGAIAAMLAACLETGATGARVLRHANSFETLRDAGFAQPPDNAVGYAGVIVGR